VITLPDPVPGAYDLRSPGRFLLSLATRQRWSLAGVALAGIAWMLTQAMVPLVVGRTLDAGVVRRDGGALLTGALVLTALGLGTAVAGVLRHRLAVSNWLQAALRTKQLVGHHVAAAGLGVGAVTTTGEVVETTSTDAPRIADLYDIVGRGSGAVIAYFVVTILLLRMDPLIGAWVAIGVPVLSTTLTIIVRPLQRRQKQHRAREGELTALGADTVAGLRVLRGIGGEAQFLERYRERSQQVRRAGVKVAGLQAGLDAAHVFLPGIFVVALTWLGAQATVSGRLSAGELVTVYGYAAFLRLPLETATELLSRGILARVAAGRVLAVLNRSDADPVADHDQLDLPPAGSVVQDPGSGLILTPGRLTALVSARPEQSVLIADRLGRLERPAAPPGPPHRPGPVPAARPRPQIGAVALDRLPVEAVRGRILVSEAEPRLFTGTLRAQIDPSGERSDAEVLAAVAVADATDVLGALPDGLDTRVEERGREFSGGQRQRLTLARAVLTEPEVLVLVEPTSAVDAHTESRVARRLREARIGRTTLVITTSPLLLDLCDQVAFLVEGRVVAVGSHRRLLRERPGYRRVVLRSDDDDDDGEETS